MDKIKAVIENYSRWKNLEKYPQRIESFIENDIILAIENSKSLIESICKTILTEQKADFGKNDSLNKLVYTTLMILRISNPNQMSKFSSGMITVIQNLGELRNRYGDTSHGRNINEIGLKKFELISSQFLISSVECIACFLIEYYEHEFPKKIKKREIQYLDDDNQLFNDYFDDIYEIVAFGDYVFLPSEILFNLDQTAYITEKQKYLGSKNANYRE